jgi:hypothetical protein
LSAGDENNDDMHNLFPRNDGVFNSPPDLETMIGKLQDVPKEFQRQAEQMFKLIQDLAVNVRFCSLNITCNLPAHRQLCLQQVNTLENRLKLAEQDNNSLSTHVDTSFTDFKNQVNKSIQEMHNKCQEVIDSDDERLAALQPVPGGAYGGPRELPQPRSSGMMSQLLAPRT